jgi:hypothetical protein
MQNATSQPRERKFDIDHINSYSETFRDEHHGMNSCPKNIDVLHPEKNEPCIKTAIEMARQYNGRSPSIREVYRSCFKCQNASWPNANENAKRIQRLMVCLKERYAKYTFYTYELEKTFFQRLLPKYILYKTLDILLAKLYEYEDWISNLYDKEYNKRPETEPYIIKEADFGKVLRKCMKYAYKQVITPILQKQENLEQTMKRGARAIFTRTLDIEQVDTLTQARTANVKSSIEQFKKAMIDDGTSKLKMFENTPLRENGQIFNELQDLWADYSQMYYIYILDQGDFTPNDPGDWIKIEDIHNNFSFYFYSLITSTCEPMLTDIVQEWTDHSYEKLDPKSRRPLTTTFKNELNARNNHAHVIDMILDLFKECGNTLIGSLICFTTYIPLEVFNLIKEAEQAKQSEQTETEQTEQTETEQTEQTETEQTKTN